VVAERYYQSEAQEYADLQSVTKSIMSTPVGIGIGAGKIAGVDATLDDLLAQGVEAFRLVISMCGPERWSPSVSSAAAPDRRFGSQARERYGPQRRALGGRAAGR
jgi:hypothetical protein